MAMSYSTLLVDIDEDGIALVTVNRPEKLNALNADVLSELASCAGDIAARPEIRGAILTGAGEKAFVAGADISEFDGLDPEAGERLSLHGQEVFRKIEDLDKPVIAAVNGFALGGGCELALSCHLRFAAEHARFGQPEVGLGLIPGYGGTQRLPRIAGAAIALELLLTGETITAARAYEIGLVNRVVAAAELIDAARLTLKTILSKAPIAVSNVLRAVRAARSATADGYRDEAALFGALFATDDFREGVSAFLQKRQARFRGS